MDTDVNKYCDTRKVIKCAELAIKSCEDILTDLEPQYNEVVDTLKSKEKDLLKLIEDKEEEYTKEEEYHLESVKKLFDENVDTMTKELKDKIQEEYKNLIKERRGFNFKFINLFYTLKDNKLLEVAKNIVLSEIKFYDTFRCYFKSFVMKEDNYIKWNDETFIVFKELEPIVGFKEYITSFVDDEDITLSYDSWYCNVDTEGEVSGETSHFYYRIADSTNTITDYENLSGKLKILKDIRDEYLGCEETAYIEKRDIKLINKFLDNNDRMDIVEDHV